MHPEVDVKLHLTDRPTNLDEQDFDSGIRFGLFPMPDLLLAGLPTIVA